MKLYDITKQYQGIFDALDENGGEITPELQYQLEVAEENLHEKVDHICGYIRKMEGYIATLNTEIARMQARKKANENAIGNLKNYVRFEMKKAEMDKIETGLFKLSIRNTKASVLIDDFEKVPIAYRLFALKGNHHCMSFSAGLFDMMQDVFGESLELTVDKNAIYEALNEGEVSGAHLQPNKTLFIK